MIENNYQKVIVDMMTLFDGIDRQTGKFAQRSGLKCKSGCGACCENPNIETTVAEVLPLAAHLWSENSALGKLEEIRSQGPKDVCVFYEPEPHHPGQGRCGIYPYRPGICRLFGFSARRDKYDKQKLVTCKIIKANHAHACQCAQEGIDQGALEAPSLTAHAFAVANIDPVHGQKFFPINQAISLAIEKIGFQFEKLKQ